MVNKSVLAQRVLNGVARHADFEALGKDEVLRIKSDNSTIHRRFVEREAKDLGEREFEHYASTEHVDGMGDIIKVNGWDLLRLKTGRVPLFWGHDSSPVPMGRILSGKRGKCPDGVRALILRSLVYEPELYQDSEWGKHVAAIVTLMQRGDMPGCSVGFIPKSARWPEKDEREELGMGQWGVIYEEQELYENSVTPIPCNPYAGETKELDRVKAALVQMVAEKQLPAEEAEWLHKAFSRAEGDLVVARTVVPIGAEMPWLKGAKPTPVGILTTVETSYGTDTVSAPVALKLDLQAAPVSGESVLRALIREEIEAVSQRAIAPLAASTVRIEQHLAELRSAAVVPTKPDSQTDKNRGVTERREEHCPPPERTTGTSRAADPRAFHRALLESAIGTVNASQDPNRHGSHRSPAQGAGDEPAQGAQRALDEA